MIIFAVIHVAAPVITGNGREGIHRTSRDNSWSGVSVRLTDFLHAVKLRLRIWFFCHRRQVGSGCCPFAGHDLLRRDAFLGPAHQRGKEINLIVTFAITAMGYPRQQE